MKIEINASFGSRFQMKTGTETLLNFVNSWVVFFNNAHKKNKVKVVFSDTYNKEIIKLIDDKAKYSELSKIEDYITILKNDSEATIMNWKKLDDKEEFPKTLVKEDAKIELCSDILNWIKLNY